MLTKFRQRTDTEICGATESGKKDSSSSEVEKNNLTSKNVNNELRIQKLEHQITQLFEQVRYVCNNSILFFPEWMAFILCEVSCYNLIIGGC